MNALASSPAATASASLMAGRPVPTASPQTRAALEEFESVLIGEMVNTMFSTVETDSMFGGGQAEEVYRSMMGQEMGREIARRGGLGLTPALLNEVIRMQGAQ
ncbi:MAG TPA: rod-binding protein [Pedomonas sp.]|uniref:rod-binding protein n=1 Tax=Pedomonas sp. TaxID=2976421 RepID=UPI002F41CDFF